MKHTINLRFWHCCSVYECLRNCLDELFDAIADCDFGAYIVECIGETKLNFRIKPNKTNPAKRYG